MPSLKNIDFKKEIKIKILLRAKPGTGKSYLASRVAGTLANEGHSVLYLDGEKGTMQELKNLVNILSGDALDRIYYEKFKSFQELDGWLETYKKMDEKKPEKDRIKLVIIDPMPLIELVREGVREAFVEQGHYYLGNWGEMTKNIENDELFGLRGSMYSIANSWAWNFMNYIVNTEYDLVCTLMYPTETKDKEYKFKAEYDGKFDYVYEPIAERDTNKIVFKANIIKKRGCLTPILTKPLDNPLGEILSIFKDKYTKNDKKEEVKEVEVKEVNNEIKNEENEEVKKEGELQTS